MKIKTWKELWPEQMLVAAEAAHSRAAEALTQAELALRNINEPSARCVALEAEIEEEWRRSQAAETLEETELIDSRREQLDEELSNEQTKDAETQPERCDALEKEIADLNVTLSEAQDELDYVKIRVVMANNPNAPGPIYSFETLSEAARAICPVLLEKNQRGETYAQVEGVRIRITGDTSLASIPPSSLNWTLNSNPRNALVLLSAIRFPSQVVHIEENNQILVDRNADKRVEAPFHLSEQSVSYVQVFDSLENALCNYVNQLPALQFIDISDEKPLPLLGEIILDACRKFAASTTDYPKFLPGQSRLTEGQIDKLVGAYWKAFLDAPWEESIKGSYFLLKHLCKRGETPNVFSYDTNGHFGFRMRTRDHDWIDGEIYCPPEHFNPSEALDPAKLTNLGSLGDKWVAELGPVKFCVNKATSRT